MTAIGEPLASAPENERPAQNDELHSTVSDKKHDAPARPKPVWTAFSYAYEWLQLASLVRRIATWETTTMRTMPAADSAIRRSLRDENDAKHRHEAVAFSVAQRTANGWGLQEASALLDATVSTSTGRWLPGDVRVRDDSVGASGTRINQQTISSSDTTSLDRRRPVERDGSSLWELCMRGLTSSTDLFKSKSPCVGWGTATSHADATYVTTRSFEWVVDAYQRHIDQYHWHSSSKRWHSRCSLVSEPCPLVRDRSGECDSSFRTSDARAATRLEPRKQPHSDSYTSLLEETRKLKLDPVDGFFLSGSVAETYGSASIWVDPKLLGLQLDPKDLVITHDLTPSTASYEECCNPTQVFAGTYRGEPVAIKQLTASGSTLENAAALAFVATSLRSLQHPHILPIIGVNCTKALDLQIVTPLACGGDLRSLLDRDDARELTWADFKCQVAIDVASALAYLHGRNGTTGIGALTSWNELFKDDPKAQLNLVQMPNRDLMTTRDRVSSLLRWVAPEVILGEPSTSASDMYAFGVLLSELDTTRRPFYDATSRNGMRVEEMAIALRVVKHGLRPSLSPACPPSIARLTNECLAGDPAQRPSADWAQYELRKVLKNEL